MRLSPSIISASLIVVSCAPISTFAVPWNGADTQWAEPEHNRLPKPASQKAHSVFPQLRWLRDTAVEKVFGIPPKSAKPKSDSAVGRRPTTSQLPETLLAKYGGDVVLRFNISTSEEEAALSEAADTLLLDVWEFADNWADIRIREDDVPSLLGLLPESLHKAYSNLMPDLARTIYQSYPSITFGQPSFSESPTDRAFTPSLRTPGGGIENIFFQNYQPLSVIVPWMRLMTSMFTSHVQMINIGVSYEGREILALRVGAHPPKSQGKANRRKTILISGGAHAREWISVSTVTYVAWSLITSYGKSPAITKLLQEFDWVFIPTLNVDGYVYTWENDRLWRKNRQQTNLRFCRGLDLDRGFGFEWDGTSFQSNPCSESYPGDVPFQAVESHRLAKWAKNETKHNGVDFVGFLDLHSYSQQVLYPYSYSCSITPPSLENLEELAMGLAKAIRLSSGVPYTVSSACEGAVASRKSSNSELNSPVKSRMETGGGSAIDWFYQEMQIKYSFQIKLRDTGSYGFLLPRDNIIPTGEEAFNVLKYFGDFLLGNKGIESNLLQELHRGSFPEDEKPQRGSPTVDDDDEELDVFIEDEETQELRRR